MSRPPTAHSTGRKEAEAQNASVGASSAIIAYAAAAEQRTTATIGGDLLGHRGVRHAPEAEAGEVGRSMREGAQLFKPEGSRPAAQFVDQQPAQTLAAQLRRTTNDRTSATLELSGASSAQPTIRPRTIATSNRFACSVRSLSVRASR